MKLTTKLTNLAALAVAGSLVISTMPINAQTADNSGGQAPVVGTESSEGIDAVRSKLSELLPGIEISSVTPTAVAGIYELVTDGQIYYVDSDAEYLFDGNLIELSTRANLTDARLGGIHMSLIEEVGEENMLIYEPENDATRSITIFTDISCGYCRRLHQEIDTLLDEGVRVRYLLFPRAGMDSQGRKDLESVWCADNPQEAMTTAKAGGEIVPKTCDNPIQQHVTLAERVGLRGTPLIYTDSGVKVPGYREAGALAEMVNSSEPLGN